MARPKSGWVAQNAEIITRLYLDENKSLQEIADQLQTNVQRVFRALKALSIKTRSKSEAQKNAIKTGRSTHPSAGKPLSDKNKKALSESIAKAWQNMSPEERTRRSEMAKKQYSEMSDRQREVLRYNAALAIREAGKNGSKLERFLLDALTGEGYNVVFHKKGAIINAELEIDILLPAKKIAIEVDGIFHTENVFGELGKVTSRDNQKNGLLLAAGYVVIRLENTKKTCSMHYQNKKLTQLLEAIKKIENEFPPKDQRLIFLKDY